MSKGSATQRPSADTNDTENKGTVKQRGTKFYGSADVKSETQLNTEASFLIAGFSPLVLDREIPVNRHVVIVSCRAIFFTKEIVSLKQRSI